MQKRKNLATKKKGMGPLKKVLLLHGWTYTTNKWQPFIKALEKKKIKAQLLKIPGLTQDLKQVWTLDDYVKWLLKKVSKDKCILIGHSNGGRIALAFGLRYPERVEKLILIDSAGIYHKTIYINFKRNIFKIIAKLGKKITNSPTLRKILYKIARESDYEKASPIIRQTMVNLITTDLTNKLSQIKIPTLLIWGENDRTTPLSDGKKLHQLVKDSKLKIIKNARHSPQFTHVSQVVEEIYDYL